MSKQIKLSDDLNSSVLSIGSESLGLSSSSNNPKESNILSGGFFFSDDFAKLAIEACKKSEFSVVLFLINENKISDYCEQDDETGYTILHYLVAYYNMMSSLYNNISDTLNKILKRDDVSSFINIQDKIYNNTPLHLAVMSKNSELADKLIKAGADPKIKNSNNLYVATDSESDVLGEVHRQATMSDIKDSPKDLFIKSSPKSESVDNNIKNMVDALFNMEKRKNNSPTMSMSASLPDTLKLTEVPRNSSDNFSEIVNTEQFLDEMIKNYSKPQKGGKISGTRKMTSPNTHEGAVPVSQLYSESENVLSEMSELSRMIGNQADETHKRVVSRIRELLGVDDVTARAYKALLYNKVKTDKPELNNYDRAVEMEKITTEDVLNSLDKSKVDEIRSYIAKKDTERASNPPKQNKNIDNKPKKDKKTKEVMSATSDMSDTSSEEEPKKKAKKTATKKSTKKSESGLSATSANVLSSESMFSETSLDN